MSLSINRPLVSARNGLLDALALRNKRDRDTVYTVAFGPRFEAFVAEHVTQVPAASWQFMPLDMLLKPSQRKPSPRWLQSIIFKVYNIMLQSDPWWTYPPHLIMMCETGQRWPSGFQMRTEG